MKKLTFFLLFINAIVSAQVGGEAVYQFLNTSTSAKQTALGGKVLTLLDDPSQAIWNPSAINSDLHNKLAVNYMSFLGDISYGSAAYTLKSGDKDNNTFHTSINYVNYGSLDGYDESGNPTGSFNANDLAFSIGYVYKITNSHISVGANVKAINSVIDNFSSFGLGGDLGILLKNPEKSYTLTLVARNFGYQLDPFDQKREKLPFELDLGYDYRMENVPLKWYLTIDHLQKWNLAQSNPTFGEKDLDGNFKKKIFPLLIMLLDTFHLEQNYFQNQK